MEVTSATRRFMRCEKCRVVTRTTGDDAYAEFHAKGCDGELRVDARTCQAVLFHGPGHQSTARCTRAPDGHRLHQGIVLGALVSWEGDEASTGYFDEPPEVDE